MEVKKYEKFDTTVPADMTSEIVRIKGDFISDENGIVSIEIPARRLTAEETKILLTLFPHLENQVYSLLRREMLISATEGL
jgi:hypothetical protein